MHLHWNETALPFVPLKSILRLQSLQYSLHSNTVCVHFVVSFNRRNSLDLSIPGWSWWVCLCVLFAPKACMPGRHHQSRSCSCLEWCGQLPNPCQKPAGDLQEKPQQDKLVRCECLKRLHALIMFILPLQHTYKSPVHKTAQYITTKHNTTLQPNPNPIISLIDLIW